MDAGVQGVPSAIVEQPVTASILLPMRGRMGLPTALMASIVVGAAQLVVTPLTQVEAMVPVAEGSQPGVAAASAEVSA